MQILLDRVYFELRDLYVIKLDLMESLMLHILKIFCCVLNLESVVNAAEVIHKF